ncbi:MAG: hypothetical protein UR52_C0002G0060 [Candidatus Gottesmanbacteria bacterium GW2011_GWA1_34_13]|uniref:DUF2130 domain-containing protein n=1 Tax=Candidatus Gottesmanbacteria bacterium GW2011_GWA1_34_13 TaxID=1618434 RepID=A0A0G0DXE7_9BACT|nr:MAG: hypothetical protein UR52_C0002G0060 [Candidatus Gottesmanbacteria bacterium GW2011_GWA1_34_13]
MPNTLTITCPKCKTSISLSDALSQQLKNEAIEKLHSQHLQDIENVKKETTAKKDQEIAEKDLQIKLQNEEKLKIEKKLEETTAQEISLRKKMSDFEIEKKTFEVEKQRQIDKERELIRLKTMEDMTEKQRLKDMDKDKVIDDLKKSLEDAQRKASQGSQQSQGEVLELDIENQLKHVFPQDLIEPIEKGVLGADIRQTVRTPLGINCGKILWESKRTKSWSNEWIAKLKSDVLKDKANIPVIISEVIPDEAKNGIGFKEGVWITLPKLAMILAALLRKSLLDVAKQKKIALNKQTKAEELYSYVTSDDFANQVTSMLETYDLMMKQVNDERTSYERMWKKREMQIIRLKTGVAGMYGSIEEISGKSLPHIKNLELPSSDNK